MQTKSNEMSNDVIAPSANSVTSTRWITHGKACNLGDIINVIQQCQHRAVIRNDNYLMFSRVNPEVMQFGIGLLDTKMEYRDEYPEAWEEMTPPWVRAHVKNGWEGRPYYKAKARFPRGTHVVCHFDARSNAEKKAFATEEILGLVRKDMINLGDRELPCEDGRALSLAEKFRLIASAQRCIGIDSGLTHLALMSHTSVEVYHPPLWPAWRFYPCTSQIIFKPFGALRWPGAKAHSTPSQ